jgi:hypothetical protein
LLSPSVDVEVLYDFGGLRIQSTIDLPWLVPVLGDRIADRAPDLHISRTTSAPSAARHVCTFDGHYKLSLEAIGDDWLLRYGDTCSVTIADSARTLRCYCPDPANLPLLPEVLVRRVLPRLATLHGQLPMHAATLADDSGAVMLLGASGAGKSTMTAALARHHGWDIFSDDMSILSDQDRHLAFPTTPGVSLWQKSLDALNLPRADCRPIHSRQGKVWYAPQPLQYRPPQPLQAVIMLSIDPEGRGIEWQRLQGPEILVVLLSQLVVFNPRDKEKIAELVARFRQILDAVPIYGVAYPRQYAALPDVAETIQRLRVGPA